MERGAIFGFMAALAICLGLLGWHYYRMHPADDVMCDVAESHCLERPYFN
jgi:hypothetical protein